MPKTEAIITIDGSALNNGQPDATAGYGVVIELAGAVGEIKSNLCPTCDENLQTNNRAELRAAQCAVNFLHELAKLGFHKDCQVIPNRRRRDSSNYLSDGRSIDASDIVGVIRTDSTFVLKGATGVNRQIRHKDLWHGINAAMDCVENSGMVVEFEKVRAHAGDWANERADEMAREMAAADSCDEGYPQEADCCTCGMEFGGVADLAVHFKEVHLGRDVAEESVFEALQRGEETGCFECTLCEREFASGSAMMQHLRDKHSWE